MISYYKTLYMCTYIQYIYLYMYIFIHTKKKRKYVNYTSSFGHRGKH